MKIILLTLILVSGSSIAEIELKESHIKKPMELRNLMISKEDSIAIFRQTFDRYYETVQKNNQKLTKNQLTIIKNEVDLIFQEQMHNLDVSGAKIMAAHFTEKELDEIIAFEKSPIGRKMAHKMLILTKEITDSTISIMQKASKELQFRIQSKLNEK